MQNPDPAGLLIGAIVILALGAYFVWFFRQSRSLLNKWAVKHELDIIHSELRWFSKGPYSLTSQRWQTVYRIRVRERKGRERSGWVCFGDSLLGLFVNKVEVSWDAKNDFRRTPDEVEGGVPCVRCGKHLAIGSKTCPFCEWTQPY